jgi:8-oxo-dGTP pyrophosphatase MutT (NUDIX family)
VSRSKTRSGAAGEGEPSTPPPEPEVRAAGGVVHRRVRGPERLRRWKRLEVALVHRPRYDDWSFPKGKREAGESDEETALREVEEETGFTCTLGPDLGEIRYRDSKGREKVVRYWAMDLLPGESGERFVPNREVDVLRWCRPAEADKLLSYEHDRVLLDRLKQSRSS